MEKKRNIDGSTRPQSLIHYLKKGSYLHQIYLDKIEKKIGQIKTCCQILKSVKYVVFFYRIFIISSQKNISSSNYFVEDDHNWSILSFFIK